MLYASQSPVKPYRKDEYEYIYYRQGEPLYWGCYPLDEEAVSTVAKLEVSHLSQSANKAIRYPEALAEGFDITGCRHKTAESMQMLADETSKCFWKPLLTQSDGR